MGFHEQGVSKATVFRDNALPPADGADGIFMLIVRKSAEEYPGATWDAHGYAGGLHYAAQCHRAHPHLRPWRPRGAARRRCAGARESGPYWGSGSVRTIIRGLP